MKKIKLFLIVFFLIFFVKNNLFAIDTVSIRYFPMHVGDFWVYNCNNWGGLPPWSTTYKSKATVVQSFVRENHTYYIITSHPSIAYNDCFNFLLRTDSISGTLRRYDSLNSWCYGYYKERLIDSLSANVGDSIKSCTSLGKKCTIIDTINIFGFSKIRKIFVLFHSYGGPNEITRINYMTKDFGQTQYEEDAYFSGGSQVHIRMTLIGCRINGIVYGDTSMVPAKNPNTEIPVRFELYQNFPNPFNNTSNLKFQIVNTGDVKLVVYDIMGREVQTLVNESLKPGTYEVTFDGSNLPSGVYYYRIVAGDFVKSKSMILIK
jgi:hypothetical protein